MDKRMLNILIGIGVAVIAITVIHGHFMKQQALLQEAILKGEIVEVVIARADIPQETTITSEMVTLERVASKAVQPGDLTSLESAVGKFAQVDILRGQHVNSNMVRSLGAIKFLSQGIPDGMRAMTIPVDKISSVEGLIKPGDRVDIIGEFVVPRSGGGSFPTVVTLFEGIKVLATNKNISPYRVITNATTATIALYPEDVKLLTYVLGLGKIRLVLRGPRDKSQEKGYTAVTMETLLKRIGMLAPPPTKKKEGPTIEVFKGTQVEDVPY